MKELFFGIIFCTLSLSAAAEVLIPTGAKADHVHWQVIGQQSDDFEGRQLDNSIWENAPKNLNVGAWTFSQSNTFIEGGKLNIMTTQDTHTRIFQDSCWDGVPGGSPRAVQRTFFYRSGAVRSAAEGVYGFYEARIKGVGVFPGLSPAFWLYSDNHPYPDRNNPRAQYVDYSEIDIVELQQADWRSPTDFDDINDMDHNLHARVEENGKIIWKRPKQDRAAQALHYEAPFDPSRGFHTYAVENRPDRIFWYVDGKLIGSKPNKWWHRPMHLIFSMGLRRHLVSYNSPCQRADPNPNNVISEGFPQDATMQIEYVKTWKALPSIWLDNPAQYTAPVHTGNTIGVTVGYHGGSDSYVIADKFDGITVNLVEKNARGFVRMVASANDLSVARNINKRYGGKTTIRLDISRVSPSRTLPAGHFYAIAPAFRASTGTDVFTRSDIGPIRIGNP